ncbi:hypothetical protein N7467_002011 [Penicillium canescens]|nr:hypothetical protein N7467_002011 [Penicillium canescens]
MLLHNDTNAGTSGYASIENRAPRRKELVFVRTGPMRINMRVFSKQDDQNTIYSIHISGLFSDITDIEMHAGTERGYQALGSCRFNKFRTSQIQFRLNDEHPSKMLSVQDHAYYRWSMDGSHRVDGILQKSKRHFVWKRAAQSATISNATGVLDLELCDADNLQVCAVYNGATPGSGKGGCLQFQDDLGESGEIGVVLTLSALIEKERQKRGRKGNFSTGMLAY